MLEVFLWELYQQPLTKLPMQPFEWKDKTTCTMVKKIEKEVCKYEEAKSVEVKILLPQLLNLNR